MKLLQLQAEFVEYIPESLQSGIIYISDQYSTASHLCACGCGYKVVTPLNPAKWRLEENEGKVSLYPSIGNWSFPCQSHYWIINNEVEWAYAMSSAQISCVRERDRNDVEEYLLEETSEETQDHILVRWWTKIKKLFTRLLNG